MEVVRELVQAPAFGDAAAVETAPGRGAQGPPNAHVDVAVVGEENQMTGPRTRDRYEPLAARRRPSPVDGRPGDRLPLRRLGRLEVRIVGEPEARLAGATHRSDAVHIDREVATHAVRHMRCIWRSVEERRTVGASAGHEVYVLRVVRRDR